MLYTHQRLENFYLGSPDALSSVKSPYPASLPESHRPLARQRSGNYSSALLILEDFDELRGVFAEYFSRRRYDIFSSATLRGALAIAYEEAPQAIIIDYHLSGETASHAIERLRAALPKSYIVLVGGPNTAAMKDRALLAGASKILNPPYDLANFNEIVEDTQG